MAIRRRQKLREMKKLNPQKKKVELFVLKRDAKYEFHEEEMFKRQNEQQFFKHKVD